MSWCVPSLIADTASVYLSIVQRKRQMDKTKPYTKQLKKLMAAKSGILSKAEVFEQIGLGETAQPLWVAAAKYEERIAPLLEVLGRDSEATLHRISAAACFEKSGDPMRAANLYRVALAGPISDNVRADIQKRLSASLLKLKRETAESVV
jgi:hypothetical protein